jgi:hypothetical protein
MDEDTEVLNWDTLSEVQWEFNGEYYVAKFNEKQKEYNGKELIIEGFMFPLEYTREHYTFLISSSPMSNCFFCGPGEAESMVYVKLNDPTEYTYSSLKVKGTFKLVSDASMGIIYELKDSEVLSKDPS